MEDIVNKLISMEYRNIRIENKIGKLQNEVIEIRTKNAQLEKENNEIQWKIDITIRKDITDKERSKYRKRYSGIV